MRQAAKLKSQNRSSINFTEQTPVKNIKQVQSPTKCKRTSCNLSFGFAQIKSPVPRSTEQLYSPEISYLLIQEVLQWWLQYRSRNTKFFQPMMQLCRATWKAKRKSMGAYSSRTTKVTPRNVLINI